MRLEQFTQRGMAAQAAVDEIIAKADTASRLTKIVVEHLGVAESDVQPDVLLVPDDSGRANLGCDSLDTVELGMAIEEEFNLRLPDDEIASFDGSTFGGLVDFIHAKREAGS